MYSMNEILQLGIIIDSGRIMGPRTSWRVEPPYATMKLKTEWATNPLGKIILCTVGLTTGSWYILCTEGA